MLYDDLRKKDRVRKAWLDVRENALKSPSDEIRSEAIAFSAKEPTLIRRIEDQLRDRRYRFGKAKGIALARPGKKHRPILVADIRDRIVQRTILDVLQSVPALMSVVSHPNSFGGIPNRSVPDAIARVVSLMKQGAKYYIKSDIDSFFTKIPRQRALQAISRLLPDESLVPILERATGLEYEVMDRYKDLEKLFPTREIGVAQGCCLSPLMGNVLLREFDDAVNSDGTTVGVRFIDDFIILGPTRDDVRAAFNRGLATLHAQGMNAYRPSSLKESKAQEGSTKRRFDFLGCSISWGFVQPNNDSQARFRRKVDEALAKSLRQFNQGGGSSPEDYRYSFASTLVFVSETVRAWANQYSFCNNDTCFLDLDTWIDSRLSVYRGRFEDKRRKLDRKEFRRKLGVFLMEDRKKTGRIWRAARARS